LALKLYETKRLAFIREIEREVREFETARAKEISASAVSKGHPNPASIVKIDTINSGFDQAKGVEYAIDIGTKY
jgi:hypothetical protein